MANQEHLDIIKQGIAVWNLWREDHPNRWKRPDLVDADLAGAILSGLNLTGGELSGADLTRTDLSGANLSWASLAETTLEHTNLDRVDLCRGDLSKAILRSVTLTRADLSRVDLRGTTLNWVDLSEAILLYVDFRGASFSNVTFQAAILNKADLSGANLHKTNFEKADLSQAKLRGANLSGANLVRANLTAADLTDADLSHAYLGYTNFAHVDLRSVKGLETAHHLAASEISLGTLIRSQGQLPEQFLRNAGVPAGLIDYIHTLATHPLHYSSCTICYVEEDEQLAHQLCEDLQASGIHCWFTPHEDYPNDLFYRRIYEAMHSYDNLLVLLSAPSVWNERTTSQMEQALKLEEQQQRQILYPLRIDEAALQSLSWWATTLRNTHHLYDFTHWKQPAEYRQALSRVLADLKQEKPT